MVEIIEAGFAPRAVDYRDGWDLQRRIHADVVSGIRDDTLVLLEHEAVFTAGSRTEPADRPRETATPVVEVDRGGRITWHGPGQLVGYPIVRVGGPREVVSHVRRLERALLALVGDLGIAGRRIPGRTGVWVDGADRPAKIAAIGVRVERGVTLHGFALNCTNALAPFAEIVPCGIADAGVTTIARETGRELWPERLASAAADAVAAELAGVGA
ncbi:lipoyl(octanoyl) transferase LipB [Microbacterium excoecariae]|uniref:lipoyl(octanoyl) transferase LipB n=1 Tax=Microbacterium excoecariae TaxID=2715210 RepID=UPI001409A079|nr:lipoyl(octanoyl) transferase LipB [Microbacterium excoecariae]